MLVISSPSGAGQDLAVAPPDRRPPELDLSISMTTRAAAPRRASTGANTTSSSDAEFDAHGRRRATFLEWAEVHEHHRYGTPARRRSMAALAAGRDVMFDIDWQGAERSRAAAPEDTVRVFILPPTMADLVRRSTPAPATPTR